MRPPGDEKLVPIADLHVWEEKGRPLPTLWNVKGRGRPGGSCYRRSAASEALDVEPGSFLKWNGWHQRTITMTNEKQTWLAMKKFAEDQSLTEKEWETLSWLTLIDRSRLEFIPGNIRWANSAAERADNLAFYRSLGTLGRVH
jgi:hypothetical protein